MRAFVLICGFTGLALLLLAPFPRVPKEAPHTYVIVLGAAQYGGQPSPAFKRRLDHALHLYQQGSVQKIVVTGGRRAGQPFSEGQVGADYLHRCGIPETALLAETHSRTTIENIHYAVTYLPPQVPVTLITDRAHAPRALALARSLGLQANVNPSSLSRSPDWRYLLREKVALAAYTLLGAG